MLEDLRWLGLEWSEGPDVGGPYAPYEQSGRLPYYREVFDRLRTGGFLFPCTCSRQEVLRSLTAPHAGEEEPIYPGSLPREGCFGSGRPQRTGRFRVPDGSAVSFEDSARGRRRRSRVGISGTSSCGGKTGFRQPARDGGGRCGDGDHRGGAWRGSDHEHVSAVLPYRALALEPPAFHHCALVTDERGTAREARRGAVAATPTRGREHRRRGARIVEQTG